MEAFKSGLPEYEFNSLAVPQDHSGDEQEEGDEKLKAEGVEQPEGSTVPAEEGEVEVKVTDGPEATREDDAKASLIGEDEMDVDDSQALISEENEVNIYYEPEEIDANKMNQDKDQFADIIQMRKYAIDKRSKFNIMEHMPNYFSGKEIALQKGRRNSNIKQSGGMIGLQQFRREDATEQTIEFSDDEEYKQMALDMELQRKREEEERAEEE